MHEHRWIVGILEDIVRYAEDNKLDRLNDTIREARTVAIQEVGYPIHRTFSAKPKLSLVK